MQKQLVHINHEYILYESIFDHRNDLKPDTNPLDARIRHEIAP